jgi:hypothetical protein
MFLLLDVFVKCLGSAFYLQLIVLLNCNLDVIFFQLCLVSIKYLFSVSSRSAIFFFCKKKKIFNSLWII